MSKPLSQTERPQTRAEVFQSIYTNQKIPPEIRLEIWRTLRNAVIFHNGRNQNNYTGELMASHKDTKQYFQFIPLSEKARKGGNFAYHHPLLRKFESKILPDLLPPKEGNDSALRRLARTEYEDTLKSVRFIFELRYFLEGNDFYQEGNNSIVGPLWLWPGANFDRLLLNNPPFWVYEGEQFHWVDENKLPPWVNQDKPPPWVDETISKILEERREAFLVKNNCLEFHYSPVDLARVGLFYWYAKEENENVNIKSKFGNWMEFAQEIQKFSTMKDKFPDLRITLVITDHSYCYHYVKEYVQKYEDYGQPVNHQHKWSRILYLFERMGVEHCFDEKRFRLVYRLKHDTNKSVYREVQLLPDPEMEALRLRLLRSHRENTAMQEELAGCSILNPEDPETDQEQQQEVEDEQEIEDEQEETQGQLETASQQETQEQLELEDQPDWELQQQYTIWHVSRSTWMKRSLEKIIRTNHDNGVTLNDSCQGCKDAEFEDVDTEDAGFSAFAAKGYEEVKISPYLPTDNLESSWSDFSFLDLDDISESGSLNDATDDDE